MTTQRSILFVEASVTGAGELTLAHARHLGLHTILMTRDPDKYTSSLRSYASQVMVADTNSLDASLRAVRKFSEKNFIDAVATTADLHVPCASYLAAHLKLPCLPFEVALTVRSKYRMRRALDETKSPHNIRFAVAQTEEDALAAAEDFGYPVVAKLINGDASDDVYVHAEPETLRTHVGRILARRTNSGEQVLDRGALIEQYVDGQEYSVETISQRDGTAIVMGVTKKETWGDERGPFIEITHSFPVLDSHVKAIAGAVSQVLDDLTFSTSLSHTECKVDSRRRIRVIEVNPRLGGDKIGSHLIEMATGQSPIPAIIDLAFGDVINWAPPRSTGAAIHFLLPDQDGVFVGISGKEKALKVPGVINVFPLVTEGTMIPRLRNNAHRVAAVLAEGKDANDARNRAIEGGRILSVRMTAK